MPNYVTIYKTPNGCDLVINGLIAKSDFTDTSFPAIMTEVDAYLTSSDGIARLVGSFDDLGDITITYTNTSDGTDYDGTLNYKIRVIDKNEGKL